MKIKSKLSIVALFSCCAITSVGFAGWVITQQDPMNTAIGGIYADNVIDCINFQNATPLRVNEGGFTDPNNQNRTILSGSFTANFEINLSNYNTSFANGATTDITLKFAKAPAKNIFATENSVATIEVACNNNSLINLVGGSCSNGTFVTTFGINSSATTSKIATFTLTYTFTFTDNGNYQSYIYDVFYPYGANVTKPSTVQFAFEISIKEKAL